MLCPLFPETAEVAPRSLLQWRREQTPLYPTAYIPQICWRGNTFRTLSQVLLKVIDDFRNYEGLVRQKAVQLHVPYSTQKSG